MSRALEADGDDPTGWGAVGRDAVAWRLSDCARTLRADLRALAHAVETTDLDPNPDAATEIRGVYGSIDETLRLVHAVADAVPGAPERYHHPEESSLRVGLRLDREELSALGRAAAALEAGDADASAADEYVRRALLRALVADGYLDADRVRGGSYD